MTPKEIIEQLSDAELKQLIEEYKMDSVPDDALVRKIVPQVFGETNILVIQMQQLIWSILEVVSERMVSYSPHIIR